VCGGPNVFPLSRTKYPLEEKQRQICKDIMVFWHANQLYLYFYYPLSLFFTHASYPAQQVNHHHITTK
jgi:hypothetical protein